MKKISILLLFAAVLSMVSCNTMSDLANSESAATASGTSCGKLMSEMYSGYKTVGKVDLTNSNTLLNVIEMGGYYKTLKTHENDAAYKKAFAAGLVTGSNKLITTENAMSTVESILKMNKLAEITEQTTSTASAAINVAQGLAAIFNAFK